MLRPLNQREHAARQPDGGFDHIFLWLYKKELAFKNRFDMILLTVVSLHQQFPVFLHFPLVSQAVALVFDS